MLERPELTVEMWERPTPHRLEPLWRDLERRAEASFCLSWAWIGAWLEALPEGIAPRALVVRHGGEVVGLGLMTANRRRRHGIIPVRSLHLNETGDPACDFIAIEYNGLLADRRFAGAVTATALAWLTEHDPQWDELYFSGLTPEDAQVIRHIARSLGLSARTRGDKPYTLVDLEKVRAAGGDPFAGFSRNTRHQLRRSIRLYEDSAGAPPTIEVAGDPGKAVEILNDLKRLHQVAWTARGRPGCFASPFFERMHAALVRNAFASGAIQMSRIAAGSHLVGCLYNFVHRGRVLAYQSGFHYDRDGRLKPGLVSHALAIRHSLEHAARIYDFMAGEGQHKAMLGNSPAHMLWLVVQRPRLKFRLEDTLRGWRRKLTV